MDEIPQADWCAEFNVPHTHRLITDCFTVDAEAANLADNRYVRAVPKDRKALEQMARNKDRDQVWDIFQQFANVLISPHWSAYVLDDQYTNLINGVWREAQAAGIRPPQAVAAGWLRLGDHHGRLLQEIGALSALVGGRCGVPTAQGDHQAAALHDSTATGTCSLSSMPPRKIGRRTSATR